MKTKWQQVFSSLQDSSQYSGWFSQDCCLDGLDSSLIYSFIRHFSHCSKSHNNNWYCLLQSFFFSLRARSNSIFSLPFIFSLWYSPQEQQNPQDDKLFSSFIYLFFYFFIFSFFYFFALLTFDLYLIMMSVKQEGIKYHFWVFCMTQSRIEPQSCEPLANTLPTSQMGLYLKY